MLDPHMDDVHMFQLMTLDQYLSETKITEAKFGRLVGLSQSQVNRIRLGASFPSWEKIPDITKATKGRVKAADFVPKRNGAAA